MLMWNIVIRHEFDLWDGGLQYYNTEPGRLQLTRITVRLLKQHGFCTQYGLKGFITDVVKKIGLLLQFSTLLRNYFFMTSSTQIH